MTRKHLLIFISLLFCSDAFGQRTTEFRPQFKESTKTTHKIKKDQAYTFGYMEVLENRQDPNSRTIEFPVYIFKSRSKNPKKDPIIYTVGGPGSSTMSSAQYMNYYKYLDDRDFILVEQRGNYYAKPHLECPEWSEAIYKSNQPNFDPDKYDQLFEQAARFCKERLSQKGIDFNGYNTNEIAADINDLVDVLGIEEYNLLTISYSTKIAQVLLRDYPEKIRSVVMDSPLPLEVNYDEESVQNLVESVSTLLSDCAKDEKCATAYPDLKNRFFQYLTEKTITPLKVVVEHPQNGELETFYLRGKDLITVFTSAYTGDVPDIPFEINKLLNNDLSSVKEKLTYLFQEPGNGAGIGMRLSVWCAEEQPFNSLAIIKRETTNYPELKGLTPAVFTDDVCKIWNVKKMAKVENQAVRSATPVLFINGEYDNETPVKWAKSMTDNFENSHHIIFKGWKHTPTTNWGNTCAMKTANHFFNNPNEKPNLECLTQIGRPQFKIE
ncbi:MAG: alpha/beta fold hydrolase [Saprospiraceae bacterium]|nr:alpha/beta fold hydrolase [Saprospiraceae bacterium]